MGFTTNGTRSAAFDMIKYYPMRTTFPDFRSTKTYYGELCNRF